MSYYELWSVLNNWKQEFSAGEFVSTFASPDPNKVLHDMAKKGVIEKTGWGRYRVNSVRRYVEERTSSARAYRLVEEAGKKYALIGPDAVYFWTKGGYQADRFFGFYPIHIAVNRRDLAAWKGFFSDRGQKFTVEGEPMRKTMFGVFYVLHPRKRFVAEDVEGASVVPLKETVRFCRENVFTYQPALEILDEMYGLRLGIEYSEKKTNF